MFDLAEVFDLSHHGWSTSNTRLEHVREQRAAGELDRRLALAPKPAPSPAREHDADRGGQRGRCP
jgi:hypothetical protein